MSIPTGMSLYNALKIRWELKQDTLNGVVPWNHKNPVGTLVKYSSVIGVETQWDVVGKTRSEAWQVCGEAVVMIEGKSGGVSLRHLTVL